MTRPLAVKWLDASTLQPKVARPLLTTWMEQWGYAPTLWIHRGDIGALEAIARAACPGEIVERRRAAVFLGDDVIGLVRIEHITLVNETVFASAKSPIARFTA